MLTIREEELNMVSGGTVFGTVFGELSQLANGTGLYRPKFAIGERVMSKSEPDLGVGTVTDIHFQNGYFYTVMMSGGQLYAAEDELEFVVTR